MLEEVAPELEQAMDAIALKAGPVEATEVRQELQVWTGPWMLGFACSDRQTGT
jgi:hypothetical protein